MLPIPDDENDALVSRLLADPLMREATVELVEQAFEQAGITDASDVTPQTFESVTSEPAFRQRLLAITIGVLAEQQAGWRP